MKATLRAFMQRHGDTGLGGRPALTSRAAALMRTIGVRSRSESRLNSSGQWLDEIAGAHSDALQAAMTEEVEHMLTSDASVAHVLHEMGTQASEALHGVQSSMYPKRLHLAATGKGQARQQLSIARYNDGSFFRSGMTKDELVLESAHLCVEVLRICP